ncbi:MAG: DUF4281 domain-containing protein [Blastochloris sp.]|nr:DUF4281 domain-containing protein [Blastochloris sp.]
MEAFVSFETLFSLSSMFVLPFWLLMIFLPHWGWTKRIIQSPWIIIGPSLIYVVLVIPQASNIMGEFGSLDQVTALLSTPFGTVVGWVHFLAFDLFVGRWAYLESREYEINAFLMAPILFFTFMLGPIGFVAYLIVRTMYLVRTKRN